MALLEIKLLGEMALKLDGNPLPKVKTQKGKALLCYLAVSRRSFTRATLASLFWPDMPESRARRNLRKVLQRLGPLKQFLIISREEVAFNQEMESWLDVVAFEAGTADLYDLVSLREAIALYQGDFLDGLTLTDSPLFEEWVLAQRARLRAKALSGLQQLISAAAESNEYETGLTYCRQCLAIEPWHEATLRELMSLLAILGQRIAALEQYKGFCRMLSSELGLEPEIATRQLAEQIKSSTWPRQEKSQKENPGTSPPHNLPAPLTPFVGRESELLKLRQLLADPDARLVTILGPGGIGKTRLALAMAAEQLDSSRQPGAFAQGVYFISLAGLESADMLLPAIAEAVNYRFNEKEDRLEQLLRLLAPKMMLLVLDNFEQLLAGAYLVDEILRAAPGIKIVLTSRERLNRHSEQIFPVEGMAYPQEKETRTDDAALDISQFSAVQLLEQRARRVQPDFSLTAGNWIDVLAICRLLQGMPLGIVLSASWLELLSPNEIRHEIARDINFLSTEMEDVPARQRSLRAAFEYSWQLLSQREQKIFCQMSIFRDGFSRAAAETVTGAGLRDLQALVNKSLLASGPNDRYDIHVLLRQFAAEKLTQMGALVNEVRERHSNFYCSLLQKHAGSWANEKQLEVLAEVTREAENVQVAWRRALKQAQWPRLAQAIDSWGWYHKWRGLHSDGEAVCREICLEVERWLVSAPGAAAPANLLWAKAMAWSGVFAMPISVAAYRFRQSLDLLWRPGINKEERLKLKAFALLKLGECLSQFDRKEAFSCLEESLRLYESLPSSEGIAKVLYALGSLDWSMGSYALARQRVEASLALQQKQGDRFDQINSLTVLGWIYQHKGHLAEAEGMRHQVLDLGQQLGDRSSVAKAMADLSYSVTFQGRFSLGRAWGKQSLELCLDDGYLRFEGYARLSIGISWLLAGHYPEAHTELRRALESTRAVNDYGVEASVHCWLGYLALVQTAYDEASVAFSEGYRLYQAVQGDAFAFLALSGLGLASCYQGDLEISCRYLVDLLTEGLRRQDFFFLLFALPGLTLFLLRCNEPEQAATVWAQARCHSYLANAKLYEELIGRDIEKATAAFPQEVLTAAQANGRSQDLWGLTAQLLGELPTRLAQ